MTTQGHISSLTFRKEERLSREKIISTLYRDGESVKIPSFVLIYSFRALPSSYPAQVMITVPKKIYGLAHDRNRIKRLMREAYRKSKVLHYGPLEERKMQAALIIIFTGRQMPDSAYVHGKIKELLKRLSDIVTTQFPNSPRKNESSQE